MKTPLIYNVLYFNLGACGFVWGMSSQKHLSTKLEISLKHLKLVDGYNVK